jgi:cytochrome c oxidase subunit II
MLDWLPLDISTNGKEIDGLMYLIYYVVGIWFLAAEGLLLYFVFKYRRKDGVKGKYLTGNTLKGAGWVLIPAVLVLVCDLAIDAKGEHVWHDIKMEMPKWDVNVRVEAQQFAWTFRHAGKSGKIGDPDNIATNGELHVPAGKVVRFEVASKDVIHSFWIPGLRLKQDVVPGRVIPGWFEVKADTKPGTKIGIGCAQMCGVGHTVMGATLIVDSPEDYAAFLKK